MVRAGYLDASEGVGRGVAPALAAVRRLGASLPEKADNRRLNEFGEASRTSCLSMSGTVGGVTNASIVTNWRGR